MGWVPNLAGDHRDLEQNQLPVIELSEWALIGTGFGNSRLQRAITIRFRLPHGKEGSLQGAYRN